MPHAFIEVQKRLLMHLNLARYLKFWALTKVQKLIFLAGVNGLGHTYLGVKEEGSYFKFYIKKG